MSEVITIRAGITFIGDYVLAPMRGVRLRVNTHKAIMQYPDPHDIISCRAMPDWVRFDIRSLHIRMG